MLKRGLTILFFLTAGITIFAQQPDPDFNDKKALQERQRFLLKSSFVENQTYADYDLVYQRMNWQIDPAVKFIRGSVTSYFKSRVQQLSSVEFDLRSGMVVDSVLQSQKQVAFTHINDKLAIQIRSLALNATDSIQVFYHGEPEPEISGFGAFEVNEHAGVPAMWTLSEPYGAMEWWPCKQSLADKIDSIDIIVTTPESYRTASNGVLVAETTDKGLRKMHWKHRHPIATYLVAIAATNYAAYSDWLDLEDGSKIEILNYVYPENLEQAKTETPVTAGIIALYNRLIGEYPFANEKYGHAQFGWRGGMEHQTMSFMYSFGFDLVAHELAHQWFGDYITCGSWQDIWLNEGFATYLTGLAYENLKNEYWYRYKKLNVERVVSQPGGSVFVKDTTDVDAIFSARLSYSKGALILHMLRWTLGDEAFFEGIQSYFNDTTVANGFANTSQFVKHMEAAGDTSLTEFFNDWFYGEGYPVYNAEFKPAGTGLLRIQLSQSQSHPSVGFFEMPVPVRVYNATLTDSANFRLINTRNNQDFLVHVGFQVSTLKIDPDYWLVTKTGLVTGSSLIKNEDEISVFPNPATDKITVFWPAGEQLKSVGIYSSEGKLIKELRNPDAEIGIEDLVAGVYFLKIETSSRVVNKKMIKK